LDGLTSFYIKGLNALTFKQTLCPLIVVGSGSILDVRSYTGCRGCKQAIPLWSLRHVNDLAHANIIPFAPEEPVVQGRLRDDKLVLRRSRSCDNSGMTSVRMSSEPAILTKKFDCDADVDRKDPPNDAKAPIVYQPIAKCKPVLLNLAPVATDGPKRLQT
jgi:hypothetical protein